MFPHILTYYVSTYSQFVDIYIYKSLLKDVFTVFHDKSPYSFHSTLRGRINENNKKDTYFNGNI